MSEPADRQWWSSRTGQVEGPFGTAYVVAGLRTRTIPSTAHACPVGGMEWRPLHAWEEFGDVVQSPPPPPVPAAGLGNPLLPPMANWIGIYAVFVAPALWFVFEASCCVKGWWLKESSRLFGIEVVIHGLEFVASLGATILVVVGGLRLRSLRRSGPALLLSGLWLGFAVTAAEFVLLIALGGFAGETDLAESTEGQKVVSFLVLVPGSFELVFRVVAVAWLHLHAGRLPLAER